MWNILELFGAFWAIWSHMEPFWTNLDPFWTIWSHLSNFEPCWAVWSHLESFGVIWSHLEPFGTIWIILYFSYYSFFLSIIPTFPLFFFLLLFLLSPLFPLLLLSHFSYFSYISHFSYFSFFIYYSYMSHFSYIFFLVCSRHFRKPPHSGPPVSPISSNFWGDSESVWVLGVQDILFMWHHVADWVGLVSLFISLTTNWKGCLMFMADPLDLGHGKKRH